MRACRKPEAAAAPDDYRLERYAACCSSGAALTCARERLHRGFCIEHHSMLGRHRSAAPQPEVLGFQYISEVHCRQIFRQIDALPYTSVNIVNA